jgi:DNA topoisomerase-2
VRDASAKRMSENKEIVELKRILGLQSGLDYATEEERATLRYGKVMLMTDQDADGSHIKGNKMVLIGLLFVNKKKKDCL